MALTKTDARITRYEVTRKWYVDIEEDGESYEAWLCPERGGLKSMMFGWSKEEGLDEFLRIVEANLDEYIEYYLHDEREREEAFMRELEKG